MQKKEKQFLLSCLEVQMASVLQKDPTVSLKSEKDARFIIIYLQTKSH